MLYIYYKMYFNNGIIKEIDYKKKKLLNITHFLFYIVHTSIYMSHEIYSTGEDDFRLFSSKNV
jgi:hypothetical protein